jgi:hypothetical protein
MRIFTMNMKSRDTDKQTDELQLLVEQVEKEHEEKQVMSIDSIENTDIQREVDLLNLPPRKEKHSENRRSHFKISKALFRFLFIVILLIVILIGVYYFFGNELISLFEVKGYEQMLTLTGF